MTQNQSDLTLRYIGYDPVERKKKIDSILEQKFDEIRKLNLTQEIANVKDARNLNSTWFSNWRKSSAGDKREKHEKDIITIQLLDIESEIESLKKEISEFKGPHFTKQYRTLYGHSEKLQTDLDSLQICVGGREELCKKRENAIITIETLAKQLASKTHPDGTSCPNCEIKH